MKKTIAALIIIAATATSAAAWSRVERRTSFGQTPDAAISGALATACPGTGVEYYEVASVTSTYGGYYATVRAYCN